MDRSHPRLALVTRATGYIGGQVAAELLRRGWQVRVLSRSAEKVEQLPWWSSQSCEVVEGDAARAAEVAKALSGVDVAWYLLHSMGDASDFAEAELDMARTFGAEARKAGVARIVYLGGLHPEGEELSEHLASRVAVGDALMASGVPTAALQAGLVIGDGPSSFQMLRHLSERLPGAVAPRWVRNTIQPVAVADAVHYLVAAADLPEHVNRTFDIGAPEAIEYAGMMSEYAKAVGLRRRLVLTAPVTTPGLAAYWVGLVTPVTTALVGSLATDPDSLWYRTLRKPAFQPPAWVFPVAWTALYAGIAPTSSLVLAEIGEQGRTREQKRYAAALAGNLALNAGWSVLLFTRKQVRPACVDAVALAVSSADLVRCAARTSPERGVLLAPYAAWTGFAAGLTGALARLNPRR
ncbi:MULTISPECIES: tryptophan-rich sensory protein [Dermacoccus]|uniref:NAD-dependent epimerase/dehydratase family protein n=3 Tax=Dermacoccus TaxID=57495 RepID=A0A417Z7W4_9MICO|nr:tryptophan-rich sensory protein [Dermacoccus abyssi]RHW46713.1 NAD-dependent epimerase/dehydratase family protein [Dermacoccus abyssi]